MCSGWGRWQQTSPCLLASTRSWQNWTIGSVLVLRNVFLAIPTHLPQQVDFECQTSSGCLHLELDWGILCQSSLLWRSLADSFWGCLVKRRNLRLRQAQGTCFRSGDDAPTLRWRLWWGPSSRSGSQVFQKREL